jgi:hypothetical protein
MAINYRYLDAKRALSEVEWFRDNIQKNISNFPDVDCPTEYKEAACAMAVEDLHGHLNTPLDIFQNRSILQVLQAKDYDAFEDYVVQFVFMLIGGPGAY